MFHSPLHPRHAPQWRVRQSRRQASEGRRPAQHRRGQVAYRAFSVPQLRPCSVQDGAFGASTEERFEFKSALDCLPSPPIRQGFSYEYATLGCLFDPLLSVQYYALASQNGEVEADMGESTLAPLESSLGLVFESSGSLSDLSPSIQPSQNGTSAARRATSTRTSNSPSPSPRRPPLDLCRAPSSLSATSRRSASTELSTWTKLRGGISG